MIKFSFNVSFLSSKFSTYGLDSATSLNIQASGVDGAVTTSQHIISKSSWFQDHVHFLLTKRLRYPANDVDKEMIKISIISEKLRKKDVFFWRRNLPNNVYKLYKRLKFFLKSIIE